jgi:hypothetical protein
MSDYSYPKYSALLNDIIHATSDGTLTWHIDDDLRPSRRDIVVGHIYVTKYRGKSFAIHEAKSKYYYDDDAWSWQYYVQFEMVDESGRMLWEMPADYNRKEVTQLLTAVREKTSGINELIESVIQGDGE